MEIFNVENLNFTYAGSTEKALKNISFAVNEGELILLCGSSGSGKTTLLRSLKPQLAPKGTTEGSVKFFTALTSQLDPRTAAAKIGFCSQSPEAQQVCDTVLRELAFGLENTGVAPDTIAKRIAETSMFFGLDKLLSRRLSELSGGERQTVNLAAVCAMQPQVLLLDEPTAQLSPVASAQLLGLIERLRRELGMTVIMTGHKNEEIFAAADRIIWLENGEIIADLPPQKAAEKIAENYGHLIKLLPVASRIFSMKPKGEIPVEIAAGRAWLQKNSDDFFAKSHGFSAGETVLECKRVGFAFERTNVILYDLNFTVSRGEFFCILGENGAGKTTLLKLLAGLHRPVSGKIKIPKNISTAYLPQNVMPLLGGDTLSESLGEKSVEIAKSFGLGELLDRHPYDLSGGEMQRAALCILLGNGADILLLDEPTRGIDNTGKEQLSKMLRELCSRGKTVICVTHDVEFAAQNADNASFLFGGSLPAKEDRTSFFSDNVYCSSAAHRITKGIIDGCVSLDDLGVAAI